MKPILVISHAQIALNRHYDSGYYISATNQLRDDLWNLALDFGEPTSLGIHSRGRHPTKAGYGAGQSHKARHSIDGIPNMSSVCTGTAITFHLSIITRSLSVMTSTVGRHYPGLGPR